MIDNPRVDLLIARHGRWLAITLVLIGALAIVATGWVVANPSTTTTTEQVDEAVVSTDAGTSATVVRDGLWESGEELEDSSVYLLNATPTLRVEPRTTGLSDDATVRHRVLVRYEAVRNGEAFWEDEEEVAVANATVADGAATSEATIDVEALADRRRQLQRELAGVGSIELSIAVVAEYDTDAYAGEQRVSPTLHVTDRAYWLGEFSPATRTHTDTAEVEVTESPDPLLVGGLVLVGLLSFAGGGAVAMRSPVDVESARRAVHERRYAEWISHGSIPMWIGDHHVSLDTLEDVVDVAIDTNERVVHDRQRGLFAVVSDDVVYYHSERGFWEETAWPDIDLEEGSRVPDVDAETTENASPPADELPDPDDDDAWHQL